MELCVPSYKDTFLASAIASVFLLAGHLHPTSRKTSRKLRGLEELRLSRVQHLRGWPARLRRCLL